MNKIIFFLTVFFLFYSCDKQNNIKKTNTPETVATVSYLGDYTDFLTGKKNKNFQDIQQKNFYKTYEKTIATNWNSFYLNQLSLIKNWTLQHNITSPTDTTTVFYPFSGPDFPFVNSFFPYAKNYIFIGLENIGQIPDLSKYSDLQLEKYIYEFQNTLSEYFRNGYFSTQNMKKNFRNPDMNGIVHPLTFFITISGYKIIRIQNFLINDFGKPVYYDSLPPLTKHIKALKIVFSDDNNTLHNLYYLQVDLSNANFREHPELITFISNFGKKNVFLKSASYLLHKPKFTYFRDFLMKQAGKILQDDSGFSYEYLKNNKLTIKLYGNYRKTLNIFKKYYQPDLYDDYQKEKPDKLSFRFGYNIPFEATALIYAVKNDTIQEKYPFYTVQFKIAWDKQKTDTFPDIVKPVDYYFDEGYYKYYSGHFYDFNKAKAFLQKVREKYPDAFLMRVYKYKKSIING